MLGHPGPTPRSPRPLHRNSTLEDLLATGFGRLVAAQAIRDALKRASTEFPDPDEATVAMIRALILEGLLRSAVPMTGGAVSFAVLDRAIAALDGGWRGAIGTAPARRPPGGP